MNIIGVDPGLENGLACLYLGTGGGFERASLPPLDAVDWVNTHLSCHGNLIACELFTPGRRTASQTRQTHALRVTGALEWLARSRRCTFIVQGASDAARLGTRDVLRTLGWWHRGDPDHVRRASAQVALAWSRTQPREFEAALGPGVVV